MRALPVLILLLHAAAAAAQPPAGAAPASPITLDEAIARALEYSHRLAELRARESAAGAAVDRRAADDRPIVSLQAGYQRTNHVDEFAVPIPGGTGVRILYPDVPDNWRTRLDLQWPIYTGGRAGALERAARAEGTAARHDLASARADLRLEVTRAFWALVTAREAAGVVEESLRRIDAQLSDVQARLDQGLIPPNDVLSVEAQRSRQQGLLIEARNRRDAARADLARLIGAPVDAPVEIRAALDAPGAPPSGSAAEAKIGRDDRRALAARAEAAGERIAAAEAARRPALALTGGYDYARPNPRIFPRADEWQDSWDVGVAVSWTLWNGDRTRAEVAEASLLADAARARLAEFDRAIETEVYQRRLDVESARAQVAAAAAGVRSAAEARRVVRERFNAGVATSTDLLDAEVVLLQAELDRTRTLAGVRLAEARLERALGR